MKKTLNILMVGIFVMFSVMATITFAAERNVTIEWDPYTDNSDVDAVLIFMKESVDPTYDYNSPVVTVPQTNDANGNSQPSQGQFTFDHPVGTKTTYNIVARGENENGQSEDSNEVSFDVDMTPMPQITDLVAVYNKTAQSIDFTWTQNQIDRTIEWGLFQSLTSGGPYSRLEQIPYDGVSTQLTATLPIAIPEPGTSITYYYVVVAFTEFGIASSDSNEVSVTIDRRPAQKVINLKVRVE